MSKLSDTAGLSEEEREALQEAEGEGAGTTIDEEKTALKNNPPPDDDDDGDGDDDEGDEGDEGAAAAASKKPDGDGQPPDEEDGEEPFVPRYVAPPVEDYDGKIAALNEREAAAIAKFKEGDITIDELTAEQSKIRQEERELLVSKAKAEVSAESQEQLAVQQWQHEVNRFFRRTLKVEGIDYRGDPIMNAAIDTAVKAIANDEKNANLDHEDILTKAHEEVKRRFKLDKPAAAADDGKPNTDEGAGRKPSAKDLRRAPNLKGIPHSLGAVPDAGDGGEDGDGNEFAHLDKLDGLDLEREIATLSKRDPAAAERYLRGR